MLAKASAVRLASRSVPSGPSSPMNWKVWSKVARNLASLWRRASSASLRAVMSSTVATKPRNAVCRADRCRGPAHWMLPSRLTTRRSETKPVCEATARHGFSAHRCAFVGMEMLDPGAVEDFLERAVDQFEITLIAPDEAGVVVGDDHAEIRAFGECAEAS